jgi:hypothetical protein
MDDTTSRPILFDAHGTSDGAELWAPTEYARGPWDPRHCHGGPVSALLARACERFDDGSDTTWQISRLTVELVRPVPVGEPLALSAHLERPGRRVSLVAASMVTVDGGVEVAKVRALRIRHNNFALSAHPLADPEIDGPPGAGRHERVTWSTDANLIAFHSHGADHRIIDGSWNDPGPVKVWIRLAADLVAGETPSGVQRAAAAADFGNGVSSALDFNEYIYINPDLTMHLARPPAGVWIGMSTHSVYGTPTESTGSGFAESALHDERGRLGRSVQSLFIDAR